MSKKSQKTDVRIEQLIMKLRRVAYLLAQKEKQKAERDETLPPLFKATTLCDLFANACGGCEWSKYGDMRPVPGWEAIRSDVLSSRNGGGGAPLESYIVLDCPKYHPDENGARYEFNRQSAIDRYMAKKEGRYSEED